MEHFGCQQIFYRDLMCLVRYEGSLDVRLYCATVTASTAVAPQVVLSSIMALMESVTVVCYGKRLQDSAHALGLPVEAPA